MQLNQITIKSRLMIIAIVAIVALALMLILKQYQSGTLQRLSDANRLVAELNAEMLQLRRHEKDFLLRQELRYLERHRATQQTLQQKLTSLQALLSGLRLDSGKSQQFARQVSAYDREFAALVQAQQQIGLTLDEGLIGAARQAAQLLEQNLANDPALMVNYLHLRRLEKDFLIRREPQYLIQQNVFIAALQASPEFNGHSQLQQYQQSLTSLQQAMAARGYSESQGTEGQMRREIQATESLLKQLSEEVSVALAATSTQINQFGLMIFVIILVLVIALVTLIARSIHRPIQLASEELARIRNDKDFTYRLTLQGKDEISLLSADMNALLADVQGLIQTVNHSLSTLDIVTDELAAAAKNSNQVMRNQQLETDMVATAITEMGATIQEIATNTEKTANTAENSNNKALTGQQQVKDSVQHIEALAARLAQASLATTELEKDSVSIGSVLDVIRAIAEQTNLLALNAAIEAARAGEQGRGFAVVADEVRTLAQRTQHSTSEIEGIIKSLQNRAKDIATVMQQCRDDGMQSAGQAAAANQLLQHITNDITQIMDMTTQIATAIEEQSSVATEVNRNVVKIRDMSEETLARSEQNSTLSEQVAKQAKQLRTEVIKFRA